MNICNLREADAALDQSGGRLSDASREYRPDRARALAALVGNPQDKFKIIHVAGTSGKTSTSYYSAALLRAAGKKVGLTVSPHVESLNERVQIDGVPLDEKEFCADLGEFLEISKRSGLAPSWFESLIVFAFWEFAKHGVDYAVVEVGLGGTWDATNFVEQRDKTCVITDIGLDHTHILGSVLSEITYWKAGIIQPGNTVFMNKQDENVMGVVRARALHQGAELFALEEVPKLAVTQDLPLFQQRNFGLALAATEHVLGKELNEEQLKVAASEHIPGRMDPCFIDGREVIFDSAHNAQKIATFADSLHAKFPSQKVAALVCVPAGRESNLGDIAASFMQLADAFIVTSFKASQDFHKESIDPKIVADELVKHGAKEVSVEPSSKKALKILLERPEEILVVTGSIYLISQLRSR